MSSLENLEHLKIPLNYIKQATNNFAYENIIDKGDFGVVYQGKISWEILAFKRLTNAVGLQKSDFYNEVMFRSTIKHQNIVSLVGFCDEDDEMILVLEHQDNGSLDMYLSSWLITWRERVYFCLNIARGLEYLQGDPQKIVLGGLKSDSIYIHFYDNWCPKIGLSKSLVMNVQPSSFNTFSNLGYVDPLYMETGRVTKETDIYSFGVILFEVLCGRQATTKDEDKGWFLSRLARHHYENGTLTEIIDPILRLEMDQDSLNVFSALAYRCLNMDPSIRPTAPIVVQELDKVSKLIDRIRPVLRAQAQCSFSLEEVTTASLEEEATTITIGASEPAPPTDSFLWGELLSKILHGVFQYTLWPIWKWRNKVVNAQVSSLNDVKNEEVFPSIQRLSMLWIAARCKRLSLNWNSWISTPRSLLNSG